MSARASHSYGALSRPRFALLQDLVQERRGGGADAERLDRARAAAARSARRRPWRRAGAARCPRCRARARRPAGVVGRVVGDGARRRSRAGAVAPAAGAAGVGEEVGEVAHARDAQVLDGAGRGLADGRRHLGGAALGDHDAGRAGALGRAADRAEVLRVLDLVERDDQRLARRRAARRRRRRGRRRRRRRRPGARASRSGARSPRPSTIRGRDARQPRLARGARAVAHTSLTARARGARAAPRARGCARRRSRPAIGISSGPCGPVADLPPQRRELLAQLVGRLAKSRAARACSRWASSATRLRVDRRDVAGASQRRQRAEAEHAEHLAQVGVADAVAAAVGLADPLEQRGERRRAC